MTSLFDKALTTQRASMVYGAAGTGKTTSIMQIARDYLSQGKRCLIMDTEQTFSIDRLKQIMNSKDDTWMDSLFLMKINTFEEQNKKISWLVDHASKFSFIAVDSLGVHYRAAYKADPSKAKQELYMQCRVLQQLSKQKHIIASNRVYTQFEGESVAPLGGKKILEFFDVIVELQNKPRVYQEHKPNAAQLPFTITQEGIRF